MLQLIRTAANIGDGWPGRPCSEPCGSSKAVAVAESRVLAWILSEVPGVCDAAKMLVLLVRLVVSRILSGCSASPRPI